MPTDRSSIVMTTDAVGGIWSYSLDLGRDLVRHDMRVVLAVLGPELDADKRASAADAGIDVIETGLAPEWLATQASEVEQAGAAVADLAVREGADLVHLNHPALAASTPFEVPVLAVCHSCVATWWAAVRGTPLPDDFMWRTDLVRRGYRSASTLVAPTRAFAEMTQRVYGLAALPEVVYNGRVAPEALVATPPLDAVFTAGRLWDDGKNLGLLDRAAGLHHVPFRAAGPTDGPNGAHASFERIEMLGPLPEAAMRAEFAARPLYASPALYEPFGLAVLEAAQSGCALVLSDIESFTELWHDAALFVPTDDPEALAAAIGRLLSDPALRADYAEAARNRSRVFGLEPFSREMMRLYRCLIDAPRAMAS
ncbi:glycosyltransferase family 4 protein [Lichenihabitans psoromatis]|uniref:glycosyltransferase family 4 protein n=1 Tax=Lichenihabitans psoromatis TaxID=2528642 RepID=UPI0010384E00|nr:glycosyltransferase family 4 protein [Lichenihabitans psoromatis]